MRKIKIKNAESKEIRWSLNKKAAERYLSFYWFFIIVVVTVAVVSMINIFYSSKYDVRDIETRFLIDKIANCISRGGVLNDFVFQDEIDFSDVCDLNFQEQEKEYFVSFDIYNLENCDLNQRKCENVVKEIKIGNRAMEDFCSLNSENLPYCKERWFYSVYSNNEEQKKYLIKIKSAVGKIEENIK